VDKVDGHGLVELVQAGLDAVPYELEHLHEYMTQMIEARRALAEVEEGAVEEELALLIDLELDVLRRAADAPAPSLRAVIRKLTIWRLAAEDHDEGQSVENAVVRSVLVDLHRLDGGAHPGQS
jgi:hypothetical protein